MSLLVMIIYVFGTMFTDVVNSHFYVVVDHLDTLPVQEQDDHRVLQQNLGTLHSSMHTLLQCVSGGMDWAEVANPLMRLGVVWGYLFVAYVFGATITQSIFLAIHELAHNLFFKSPLHNRLFSMVANWPIGIPYTIPFRGYHLEHHKFQGVDGVDTDVPSYFEAQHIRGPLSKTAWACCQILTYALRPMFIKAQDITAMHVTNWAVQIAFDAAMLYAFGWRPLAYMVLCILLAGGLHPCAGHFISEHYVFPHLAPKQETYSYYGPLNYLTWNVGYHNEHHDFPYIPWSRLPELRRIAPEFYDNLAVCESWVGVIWDYIMRDDVGPYNRVKRPMPKEE